MKLSYSIKQRLIAHILLLSLFLQNCSNPPILPVLPSSTEQTSNKKQISKPAKQERSKTKQLLEEGGIAPIEGQLETNTQLQVDATLAPDVSLYATSPFTEQSQETVTSTDMVAPSSVLSISTTPPSKLNSQPAITVGKDVKRRPSSIEL